MRGFLINKNLSFYYWLRKRIGKKWAWRVAITIENGILVFQRPKLKEIRLEEEPLDIRSCRSNS
ncbi:MAG: hypothetical protein H6Q48_2455 [Deltaproteobacteria bacterium]|jgi:hypothetical protein|nr:hypothetical protein [Deltaproteobacteria bacterium]